MPSDGIIKPGDVFEYVSASLRSCFVALVVNLLTFQGGKEALHDGIAIAIAIPAHTDLAVVAGQAFLVSQAGVLTALVGVVQQANLWLRPGFHARTCKWLTPCSTLHTCIDVTPRPIPRLSPEETFILVDVETSGPTSGDFSLLSINACPVMDLECTFYVELRLKLPIGQPEGGRHSARGHPQTD